VEAIKALPEKSVHLSVYSPPFCGLYNYSSDDRDMSNCKSYDEFFEHYGFLVKELGRVTMPGRMTAVHCMDVPAKGGAILDFPGDIIRLHQKLGWKYHARYAIWKEPLRVAIRTRSKGLMHRQIVKDSTFCNNAGADYVVVFKAPGDNPAPVANPTGLAKYVGEREIPEGLEAKFKDWPDHSTNKLAHWIWQQYASSFWDDIRINRVLPYKAARDKDDEKHVHPLQLDVIERLVLLWTNPGEVVLTPFMGVGSEVYGAVINGRKGVGIELKATYFRQAIKNLASVDHPESDQTAFEFAEDGTADWPDIADEPGSDEPEL
jgi:DNA modification methylase